MTKKQIYDYVMYNCIRKTEIANDRLNNHPEDKDYYQGYIDALYEISSSLDKKMINK